jgi:hypothetical protein
LIVTVGMSMIVADQRMNAPVDSLALAGTMRGRSDLSAYGGSVPGSISAALRALAANDSEAADDARSSIGWIVGDEDVDDPAAVSLAGVERFVWYDLAVKWMMPDEDKPPVVDALARVFDLLDRSLCAELCRSPLTVQVLAAWAESHQAGRKAYDRAMKTSMVEPVDSDRLVWGSTFGLNEALARDAVENALEEALVTGRLVRGRQGWRTVQKAVVDEVLDSDHPSEPAQSWLTSIITERLSSWVGDTRRSQALTALRARVANQLLAPIPPPEAVVEVMEPVLWFCDELCAGGIDLTQKGFLGQKFVQRTATERGWWTFRGTPRTETDVWQLHELHALTKKTRLAQREGTRLMPTLAGIESRSKPQQTWGRIVEHLAGGGDFEQAAFEVCMLIVVAANGPVSRTPMVADATQALAESGWKTGPKGRAIEPVGERQVSYAFTTGLRRLNLLGLTIDNDDWKNRQIELTPTGRIMVLAWLRNLATGPRHGFA